MSLLDDFKAPVNLCSLMMNFVGSVDTIKELYFIKDKKVGDLWHCNETKSEWLWVGSEFEEIGPSSSTPDTDSQSARRKIRTHCISCGAPLDADLIDSRGICKCKFCDTSNNAYLFEGEKQ